MHAIFLFSIGGSKAIQNTYAGQVLKQRELFVNYLKINILQILFLDYKV